MKAMKISLIGLVSLFSILFVGRKDRTGMLPSIAAAAQGRWSWNDAAADSVAALTGYDFRYNDWKPPIGLMLCFGMALMGNFLSKWGVSRWLGQRWQGLPVRL